MGIAADDATAMYLAHQQCVGGARKIYRNLGTGKTMNQIVGDERAKKNGMDGVTADAAVSMWGGKADRFAKKMGLASGGAWKPTGVPLQPAPATTYAPPPPPVPVVPSYLAGTSAPTPPPPYAPMQAFQTPAPPTIPQAPLQSSSVGLTSSLMPSMMPIQPVEPAPVTLESIIKRAADISGNKNRAGFGAPSIDPMTYDIMRLIENS
jgi:hypothetical protein